jgi:hypothetical protein
MLPVGSTEGTSRSWDGHLERVSIGGDSVLEIYKRVLTLKNLLCDCCEYYIYVLAWDRTPSDLRYETPPTGMNILTGCEWWFS